MSQLHAEHADDRALSRALSGHHRLGFFGRFGHYFISLSDADNLFDGCSALGDAPPAVVSQRFHTFSNSALLQFAAVALLHDESPQRLGDEANFVDRRATLIAGLAALVATGAAPDSGAVCFPWETEDAL